ncbi:hypothetical protein HanXRQr2_Chr04g0165971 [Helianthus annuus]|uniref:Uncharacterized protein n=1 Tax=Helianthus annuus TaxID=4232 RepID=A0A9K3NR93_HELAN|nr:hypothetical protein HanXRQr2_Chr04g0165971 [Helianthus annuus]KAJ0931264.1 hypothetical protein HanPSC8_Chr04g0159631 [Helianthus annuus]
MLVPTNHHHSRLIQNHTQKILLKSFRQHKSILQMTYLNKIKTILASNTYRSRHGFQFHPTRFPNL